LGGILILVLTPVKIKGTRRNQFESTHSFTLEQQSGSVPLANPKGDHVTYLSNRYRWQEAYFSEFVVVQGKFTFFDGRAFNLKALKNKLGHIMAPMDFQELLKDPRKWVTHYESLEGAKESFHELVSQHEELRSQIPSLNQTPWVDLPNLQGQLCRFYGMVQDNSLSPEIYPAQWRESAQSDQVQKCILSDEFPEQFSSQSGIQIMQYKDRFPLYVISVPGATIPAELACPSSIALTNKAPLGAAEPHQAMVAKFYLSQDLKLCDTVEMVGVFQVQTETSDGGQITPSGIPVLHVFWWGDNIFTRYAAPMEITSMRSQSVNLISDALEGDVLSAELLLLHLFGMSHVGGEKKESTSPTAIAITAIGSQGAMDLTRCLRRMGFPTVMLSISNESLQAENYNPCGNASVDLSEEGNDGHMWDGGLKSGKLQLSYGSVLVLDESSLKEGQLNEKGM
jgi:hypothetical protein